MVSLSINLECFVCQINYFKKINKMHFYNIIMINTNNYKLNGMNRENK